MIVQAKNFGQHIEMLPREIKGGKQMRIYKCQSLPINTDPEETLPRRRYVLPVDLSAYRQPQMICKICGGIINLQS